MALCIEKISSQYNVCFIDMQIGAFSSLYIILCKMQASQSNDRQYKQKPSINQNKKCDNTI
jgi:hypothetical protein